MPFQSQAQRAKCYALRAKGKSGTWDCSEWEAHTPEGPLPAHLEKDAASPPHYRPAASPLASCGSCTHFQAGGLCALYAQPVSPAGVCDSHELPAPVTKQALLGHHGLGLTAGLTAPGAPLPGRPQLPAGRTPLDQQAPPPAAVRGAPAVVAPPPPAQGMALPTLPGLGTKAAGQFHRRQQLLEKLARAPRPEEEQLERTLEWALHLKQADGPISGTTHPMSGHPVDGSPLPVPVVKPELPAPRPPVQAPGHEGGLGQAGGRLGGGSPPGGPAGAVPEPAPAASPRLPVPDEGLLGQGYTPFLRSGYGAGGAQQGYAYGKPVGGDSPAWNYHIPLPEGAGAERWQGEGSANLPEQQGFTRVTRSQLAQARAPAAPAMTLQALREHGERLAAQGADPAASASRQDAMGHAHNSFWGDYYDLNTKAQALYNHPEQGKPYREQLPPSAQAYLGQLRQTAEGIQRSLQATQKGQAGVGQAVGGMFPNTVDTFNKVVGDDRYVPHVERVVMQQRLQGLQRRAEAIQTMHPAMRAQGWNRDLLNDEYHRRVQQAEGGGAGHTPASDQLREEMQRKSVNDWAHVTGGTDASLPLSDRQAREHWARSPEGRSALEPHEQAQQNRLSTLGVGGVRPGYDQAGAAPAEGGFGSAAGSSPSMPADYLQRAGLRRLQDRPLQNVWQQATDQRPDVLARLRDTSQSLPGEDRPGWGTDAFNWGTIALPGAAVRGGRALWGARAAKLPGLAAETGGAARAALPGMAAETAGASKATQLGQTAARAEGAAAGSWGSAADLEAQGLVKPLGSGGQEAAAQAGREAALRGQAARPADLSGVSGRGGSLAEGAEEAWNPAANVAAQEAEAAALAGPQPLTAAEQAAAWNKAHTVPLGGPAAPAEALGGTAQALTPEELAQMAAQRAGTATPAALPKRRWPGGPLVERPLPPAGPAPAAVPPTVGVPPGPAAPAPPVPATVGPPAPAALTPATVVPYAGSGMPGGPLVQRPMVPGTVPVPPATGINPTQLGQGAAQATPGASGSAVGGTLGSVPPSSLPVNAPGAAPVGMSGPGMSNQVGRAALPAGPVVPPKTWMGTFGVAQTRAERAAAIHAERVQLAERSASNAARSKALAAGRGPEVAAQEAAAASLAASRTVQPLGRVRSFLGEVAEHAPSLGVTKVTDTVGAGLRGAGNWLSGGGTASRGMRMAGNAVSGLGYGVSGWSRLATAPFRWGTGMQFLGNIGANAARYGSKGLLSVPGAVGAVGGGIMAHASGQPGTAIQWAGGTPPDWMHGHLNQDPENMGPQALLGQGVAQMGPTLTAPVRGLSTLVNQGPVPYAEKHIVKPLLHGWQGTLNTADEVATKIHEASQRRNEANPQRQIAEARLGLLSPHPKPFRPQWNNPAEQGAVKAWGDIQQLSEQAALYRKSPLLEGQSAEHYQGIARGLEDARARFAQFSGQMSPERREAFYPTKQTEESRQYAAQQLPETYDKWLQLKNNPEAIAQLKEMQQGRSASQLPKARDMSVLHMRWKNYAAALAAGNRGQDLFGFKDAAGLAEREVPALTKSLQQAQHNPALHEEIYRAHADPSLNAAIAGGDMPAIQKAAPALATYLQQHEQLQGHALNLAQTRVQQLTGQGGPQALFNYINDPHVNRPRAPAQPGQPSPPSPLPAPNPVVTEGIRALDSEVQARTGKPLPPQGLWDTWEKLELPSKIGLLAGLGLMGAGMLSGSGAMAGGGLLAGVLGLYLGNGFGPIGQLMGLSKQPGAGAPPAGGAPPVDAPPGSPPPPGAPPAAPPGTPVGTPPSSSTRFGDLGRRAAGHQGLSARLGIPLTPGKEGAGLMAAVQGQPDDAVLERMARLYPEEKASFRQQLVEGARVKGGDLSTPQGQANIKTFGGPAGAEAIRIYNLLGH